jgi:hypothetical protein
MPVLGPAEMAGQRLILKAGILALSPGGGTAHGTYIEAGEIVTLKAEPVDGQLLVEAEWNGLVVAIFVRDLLEHAKELGGDSSPP